MFHLELYNSIPVSLNSSLALVASTHSSDRTQPLAPVLMASAEAVLRKLSIFPNKFFLDPRIFIPDFIEQTLSLVA